MVKLRVRHGLEGWAWLVGMQGLVGLCMTDGREYVDMRAVSEVYDGR